MLLVSDVLTDTESSTRADSIDWEDCVVLHQTKPALLAK